MFCIEKPNLHVLIRSWCFCGGVATNSSALSLLNTKSVCHVSTTKALLSSFTDLIIELEDLNHWLSGPFSLSINMKAVFFVYIFICRSGNQNTTSSTCITELDQCLAGETT